MRPAIFIDRDNTINKFVHQGIPGEPDTYNYLLSWDEFEFLPRAVEGMRFLFDEGLSLVVVSNQSCVNRGLIRYEEMEYIFEQMDHALGEKEVFLDAYYFCPHDPDGGLPCSCHKPRPGLFYAAAFDLDISLKHSWMIGDRVSDMQAAFSAGIAYDHIILVGERQPWEADAKTAGTIKLPTLYGAARYIVEAENK